MSVRFATAVCLPLALAACANDGATTSELLPTSALASTTRTEIRGAGSAADTSARGEAPAKTELPKKTIADRVLTAIALERVTGLKPDPSRLLQ